MAAASFLFALTHYIMISQHFLKLILLISLPSFVLFFIKSRKNSSHAKRLPPGPPKLPLIGNMHQFRNPLHKSLHDLAKKYGDIMLLQVGSVPTLVISSADIAREIVKSHDIAFSGRASTHVIKKFSYDCADLVFAPYGEFWKEIRKLSVTELLSAKRVQSFQAVREEEVTLLLDNIARSSGRPIELDKMLRSLSVNVLTSTAFGTKFQADGGRESVAEALQEAQTLTGAICFSDLFPRLGWLDKLSGFDARMDRIFRQLDEHYDKVIQDHLDPSRRKAGHEDFVDVLLRLRNDPTQTIAKSRNFVKAVITDMFAAGSETTGTTLVWAMTELIRNPVVMKRAQDEVRRVAKGKVKVEENDLQQLVYLKAVVKETMRLHTPAPLLIPRETIEPCKIRGYEIPAKMRVFINAMPIAMDPRSWESPHEFRPERFLDGSVDFQGQNFEYIPFGVGRRICPGINFSVVVLELVISNLLHRFDWELPQGMTREDVDVEDTFSLVTAKKTPLILVAKPTSE